MQQELLHWRSVSVIGSVCTKVLKGPIMEAGFKMFVLLAPVMSDLWPLITLFSTLIVDRYVLCA